MNRYILAAKAFVPKTLVGRGLVLLIFLWGLAFAPIVATTGKKAEPWLDQYAVTIALLGIGAMLGMTLRRVRAWTPFVMVSGLWQTLATMAVATILSCWTLYVAILVHKDSLIGLPMTGSLTVGIVFMAASAGIYRRAFIALLASSTLMLLPAARQVVFAALHHPFIETALSLVCAATVFELFRAGRLPVRHADLARDEMMFNVGMEPKGVVRSHMAAWFPITRSTGRKAFAAALEHSPAQAWCNDGALFGMLLLLTAVTLIGAPHLPSPAAIAVFLAFFTAIFASIMPLIRRRVLAASADVLWLTGTHATRRDMIRAAFLRLMQSSLRLSAMGLAVVIVLSSIDPDPALITCSLALILAAPAAGAMTLAVALVFGRQMQDGGGIAIVTFGLSLLVIMMSGGAAAGWVSLHWSAIRTVVTFTLLTSVVMWLSANAVAAWIASRRQWSM